MTNTQLIGILNVTPDSFSDGGDYFLAGDAIARAQALIDEGADLVDIGAESTRPGATPMTHAEEWERLATVLSQPFSAPVSVDTRHAQTAVKALACGAQWINDVSGFSDDAMIEAVRHSPCKLVLMHSLGVPADKHIVLPQDCDVMAALIEFAHTRIGYMQSHGIGRGRIIFDPGIGFGKTAAQSRYIIENISGLKAVGVPLLVGHSRKSFLGLPKDATNEQRDAATLEMSRGLIANDVEYLRVHNVGAHRKLLDTL